MTLETVYSAVVAVKPCLVQYRNSTIAKLSEGLSCSIASTAATSALFTKQDNFSPLIHNHGSTASLASLPEQSIIYPSLESVKPNKRRSAKRKCSVDDSAVDFVTSEAESICASDDSYSFHSARIPASNHRVADPNLVYNSSSSTTATSTGSVSKPQKHVRKCNAKRLKRESAVGAVNVQASEFIAFATYKLWNQNKMNVSSKCSSEQETTTASTHGIICPPGTRSWYPAYVLKIHHVLKSSALTTPFILMSLLYIARIAQVNPSLGDDFSSLFTRNIDTTDEFGEDQEERPEFLLFLASLMISQKQNSDSRYANNAWAKLCNQSLATINKAERMLLQTLNFKTHISDVQFSKWEVAMQALGKEHAIVLRAVGMDQEQVCLVMEQLKGVRPDLVSEIINVRREHYR